jgi:hypothetical protein
MEPLDKVMQWLIEGISRQMTKHVSRNTLDRRPGARIPMANKKAVDVFKARKRSLIFSI